MAISSPHSRMWRGIKVSAILSFFFSFIFIAIFNYSNAAVDPKNGEQLFKSNCVSCHYTPNKDQILIGPSLKNVHKSRSEEWLMKWIKNNAALRKSGDKDAIAIWEKFGKNEMTSFLSFSDDDLKSIIEYIKVESEKPSGPPPPPPLPPGKEVSTWTEFDSIILTVVIVLVVLIFLLTRINRNLHRLVLEKAGEPVPEPRSLLMVIKNKTTIATILLILIIVSGYKMVEYTQTLGRSKNYQPVQPIKFSHKIHAGQNQINCLYCHAGAEKSKTASIPSVNVCMNCHKAVKEGPLTGTAEIAKIQAAYDNNIPVKWVKIHNLPDHVYFNHSQHVAVGKVECQTCHGPIETMDEVKQFSSLSMGWCINCHRSTGVQFASNNYYSSVYEQLHKDLKDGKIKTVTEEMMGGTECQKCHY